MKKTPGFWLGIALVLFALALIGLKEYQGAHIAHWYFILLAFGCLIIAPVEGGNALDKLVIIVTSARDILPGGKRRTDPPADAVVVDVPKEMGDETGG